MSLQLRTKALIPHIGLGFWEIQGKTCHEIVREAIATGYRHLDGAAIYGNERELGQALNSVCSEGLVKRSDLFITSKLWCTMMSPEKIEEALNITLKDLQTDYVDLYLIHWPMCFKTDDFGKTLRSVTGSVELTDASIDEVWVEINKMVEKGMAKAVGVCNFTVSRLDALIKSTGLVPSVLQVELHPYLPQNDVLDYCRDKGIVVEAYSPLGAGREPKILDDPVVKEVANKEGLTPAQTLLSWAITRGTVPLVRTSKVERLAENFVTDQKLSDESMKALNGITTRHRYVDPKDWAGHDVFQ